MDEAKNDASAHALVGVTERKALSMPVSNDENFIDKNNDNSFEFLKQMINGLQYHCHKIDDFFLSSVMVCTNMSELLNW